MDTGPDRQLERLITAIGSLGVDGTIEVIETRMSWVLLKGAQAFKMKKALRTEWVDLRSVQARQDNAIQELHLNRRLSSDVYLAVLALVEQQGQMRLMTMQDAASGSATVLDWVVQMRRLPAHRSLDALLLHGELRLRLVEPLAAVLCAFYRHCPPVHLTPEMHHRHLVNEAIRNGQVLERVRALHPAVSSLLTHHLARLEQVKDLILQRVDQGHLVDGHGDLRPEHIFLLPEPQVIDCLEFSNRLRTVDPIDELAGLDIECAVLECDWIGPWILERYVTHCADAVPASLYSVYAMGHCLLRARQCAAHLLNKPCLSPQKWQSKTRRYLDMALRAADSQSWSPSAMAVPDGIGQQTRA
jgi:aminoglycoside phosphotransferase family enzyme